MLVGMLNWLQQCTCPDISTIFSLLASHMHCPSPGHIDAVRYVGRYLLSTLDLGLIISTCANASLESYIYFPLPATSTSSNIPSLIMFCDADWGPQDTSQKIVLQCLLMSLDLSVVIFSFMVVVLFSGKHTRRLMSFALHVRQKLRIWMKVLKMFHLLLSDLHLCPIGPIPVYNDNQGTVDWSHTFSTKGVRHLNIRQNAVCEAEWLQKISV